MKLMHFSLKLFTELKDKYKSHLKRIKNALPYFKIVISVYIFLFLFYVVFFVLFSKSTINFLDSLFGTSFGLNFSASLLEDLFVFGSLGILGTLISTMISTKTPEEYAFTERIKAIMNSENVVDNKLVYKFFEYNIISFLAFNKKAVFNIIVEDYNDQKKAYKVFNETIVTITNMCRDTPYNQPDPNAYIYPDAEINGSYGYVSHLSTFEPKTNKLKSKIIDGNIYELLTPDTFKKEIDIDIEKNSEIGWRVCYAIWNSQDDDKDNTGNYYRLVFSRYSQNVYVNIENKLHSKKTLKLDVKHFRNKTDKREELLNAYEIVYNQKKEVPLIGELYPGDKIEFYFYNP